MNQLQIFENKEFGKIRTVEINDEPYFVGKDVADILGYTDTFGALKKHVDTEDKLNCQNDSFESNRGMTVVNESGLYSNDSLRYIKIPPSYESGSSFS